MRFMILVKADDNTESGATHAHRGAARGPGAYESEGNRDVGKGRMEITETSAAAQDFETGLARLKAMAETKG